MISRPQRFWNAYARYIQKPVLAHARPQWLARKATSLNAMSTYRQPRGLTLARQTLTCDGRAVDSTACTVQGQQSNGTLLYIHGGAFVIGNLRGYKHLIARMGRQAGLRGVYIDYRLAPEHPYPAALDDAETAYRALLDDPDAGPIAIAGDSAGGNIALALVLRLKRKGLKLPFALALMSPLTDLRLRNPSLTANLESDHLVPMSWGMRGVSDYLAGQDPATPEISPILGDFTGCPPVFMNVDKTEVLYDDSRLMAERLQDDGVDVTLKVEFNLPHVWHLNCGRSPEANASVRDITTFLKGHMP